MVRVEPDGLQPDTARRRDRGGVPQHPAEVAGKGRGGWPGRRAQLELAAGLEGRDRRPGKARIESGCQAPPDQPGTAARCQSPGSARPRPLPAQAAAPGRTAAARPCSSPCRQARPRPPPRTSVLVPNRVLNLYRDPRAAILPMWRRRGIRWSAGARNWRSCGTGSPTHARARVTWSLSAARPGSARPAWSRNWPPPRTACRSAGARRSTTPECRRCGPGSGLSATCRRRAPPWPP